jgi:shikimate dehydrogenase
MESKKSNIKRYGLVGKNIEYSFSRGYFKQKFETDHLPNCNYENFDLKNIEAIKEVLTQQNICGLNVTIPYKREVIPFLDFLSTAASEMNAVNTLKFEKNGSISGHNTDVYGFEKSLLETVSELPKKALILGTGGASSAIAFVMKKLNIEFTFVSRQKSENSIEYSTVDESVLRQHLLIINASPVGTFPKIEEAPDLPYHGLTKDHILFDLIYNPLETQFLKEGKARECKVSNGLKMLEYQAEKSWEIWNQ